MKLTPNIQPSDAEVAYTLTFKLPAKQNFVSEAVTIYGRYTVTDAGIAASEDVFGWVQKVEAPVKFVGSSREVNLFEFLQNEEGTFLKAVYQSGVAIMYDGQPTTAEAQGFGLRWRQHIDFRMIESGIVKITTGRADAEWDADATIADVNFHIDLEGGKLPDNIWTEAYPRYTSASATVHSVPFTTGRCVGVYYLLSTSYATEVEVEVSEGVYAFRTTKWYDNIPAFLRAAEQVDASPSADLPLDGKTPMINAPAKDSRKFNLNCAGAAVLYFWPRLIYTMG
jgi:hypothetical protein